MISREFFCRVVPFILCCTVAFAADVDVTYNLSNDNPIPSIAGEPGGVAFSNFSVGSLDVSGGTNGVPRIKGGLGTDTRAAITANRTLSFTVSIPAQTTVTFKSLRVDFSTNFPAGGLTNARIFTEIQGDDDLTGDTVGIVGKQATDPSSQTFDVINLENPTTNPGKGGNIGAADFSNLTDRSLTIRMPWLSNQTATSYIEISQVTFSYEVVLAPEPPAPFMVTDFRLASDHSAEITFTGPENGPYALMASADLVGPLYRKRWTPVMTGSFSQTPVTFSDSEAIGKPRRFYSVAKTDMPRARIMPVGDSITEGGSTFKVYRGPLYDMLRTAGFRFEFVGTRSPERTYNSPLYGTVTLNHLGQGGANAEGVRDNLAAAFPSNPADIVLIHSGHNFDLASNTQAAIITRIENATRAMISTCRTVNPKVKILLAQVITSPKISENNSSVVKYAYIPALNIRLAEVAAELTTVGSPIIIVNQAEGWNTPTDAIGDLVHPSQVGAEKMAVKWFNALTPLLE